MSNSKVEVNYEQQVINASSGISNPRNADGPTARRRSGATRGGNTAHFERSARVSRQRSFDDHSGISTGQRGSHSPAQCTRVRLCVGGLNNHAGEKWQGGDADAGPDFL